MYKFLVIGFVTLTIITLIGISENTLAQSSIDITKLTGDEKIEVSGNIKNIEHMTDDSFFQFSEKPVIKINDQILDFEYPVDTSDDLIIDDTIISMALTIKVPISETESKVLDVGLFSKPDTIKTNPDGSVTYTNKPGKLGEWLPLGEIFYHNVNSTATINGDKTQGTFNAKAEGQITY